ncbi:hypothetical protein RB213_004969 [Colletotrichum asianum]
MQIKAIAIFFFATLAAAVPNKAAADGVEAREASSGPSPGGSCPGDPNRGS